MERSIRRVAALVLVAFGVIALALTYWQVIRADDLVYGENNPRLAREEARIERGRILDRTGRVLAHSETAADGVRRLYDDPTTAPVTGYFSLRYGGAGIESSFSRYLRGDIRANPIDSALSSLLHRAAVGDDLTLTLHPLVQSAAVKAMGTDRGAAIAIDPHSGAILAMVSVPSFDPNEVDEQWDRLQSDPGKPLLNRATQGLYTPGSVFKIVTATAAIDLGLVDIDEPYTDTQDLVVDGFRIENKNHPGITRLTFVDDFAYSNNVTFAKAGLALDTKPLPVGDDLPNPPPWAKGIEESRRRFLDYARRFGIESTIPFDVPTSASRIGSESMSRVELANTAFGQGELQVTPLFMALGAATIANGGVMPRPYLVEEIRDAGGSLVERHEPGTIRRVMSAETARSMNRLMVTSVQEGYAKPAQMSGVQVGGKTGSAEVGSAQKTHSWFIGYAPADDPRVAVAVIMENKGSGSDFATPAGRAIMLAALRGR